VRPAEANRTVVKQAISPIAQALTARDASGTNEARVLVRRREKAEVGPTHRAGKADGKPQGERSIRRLTEEVTTRRAGARP
jgi:hypothetical protein